MPLQSLNDPKTLTRHRSAVDGAAPDVGGQCRCRPPDQPTGSADHPQLFALGCGPVHLVAAGPLGAAPRQWTVDTLEAFWLAQFAGRGLLQRAAISGPANLHPAERDPGCGQQSRLDAGHWCPVFSNASAPCAGSGRLAVGAGRGRCLVTRRLDAADGRALGHWRLFHLAGHRVLVLVQLAAQPQRRTRSHSPGLGGVLARASGFRLGLVGPVCRHGMGLDRCPHQLGLATGQRLGLCGGRPCRAGLPLLGSGHPAGGPYRGWFFCQPHTGVCRHHVGSLFG